MNTSRPTPRPKNSRLHVKLFILSTSLFGTILLWNLFSSHDINTVAAQNAPKDDNSTRLADMYGLGPMPTLVDVRAVQQTANQSGGVDTVEVSQPADAGSGLRKVAQPTPLPTFDKPQVETINIVQAGSASSSSSSSSRGGSSKTTTSTRSSK